MYTRKFVMHILWLTKNQVAEANIDNIELEDFDA